jgi:hypothetical protein
MEKMMNNLAEAPLYLYVIYVIVIVPRLPRL